MYGPNAGPLRSVILEVQTEGQIESWWLLPPATSCPCARSVLLLDQQAYPKAKITPSDLVHNNQRVPHGIKEQTADSVILQKVAYFSEKSQMVIILEASGSEVCSNYQPWHHEVAMDSVQTNKGGCMPTELYSCELLFAGPSWVQKE